MEEIEKVKQAIEYLTRAIEILHDDLNSVKVELAKLSKAAAK